jgi:hypothetical protein
MLASQLRSIENRRGIPPVLAAAPKGDAVALPPASSALGNRQDRQLLTQQSRRFPEIPNCFFSPWKQNWRTISLAERICLWSIAWYFPKPTPVRQEAHTGYHRMVKDLI